MKVIIDRFEGDYALVEVEENKVVKIPRILLPNANEGDVINIFIDKEETLRRREEIKKQMNDLF